MIDLSGKYEDASTREYVIMQDDAQRQDRRAFIALLRVMRQRDETVHRGIIYIPDETFADAGADEDSRNGAIGRALVWWLAERPAEAYFQLRAVITESEGAKTVELIDESRMTPV